MPRTREQLRFALGPTGSGELASAQQLQHHYHRVPRADRWSYHDTAFRINALQIGYVLDHSHVISVQLCERKLCAAARRVEIHLGQSLADERHHAGREKPPSTRQLASSGVSVISTRHVFGR